MSSAYMNAYRKKRPDKTKALDRKHAAKKYEWIRIARIFRQILIDIWIFFFCLFLFFHDFWIFNKNKA